MLLSMRRLGIVTYLSALLALGGAAVFVPTQAFAQSEDEPVEDNDDDDPAGDVDPGADPADDPDSDDPGSDDPGTDDPGSDDPAGDDPAGDDPAGDDDAGGASDDDGGTDDDDAPTASASAATGGDDDDDDDDDDVATGATGGLSPATDDDRRARSSTNDRDGGVRGAGSNGDRNAMAGDEAGRGRLASGFELQQDEVFDERGFLARRGEIIALEASARGLDAARKLGFRVIERGRLQVLGTSVVRLQTPANLSTLEALRLIRNSDPAGRYDYNHLYDGSAAPQVAQAPANSRSRAPAQRRGTRPPQRAPAVAGPSVRLGIIDTSVDARHEEFQGRRLTTQNFGDRAQASAVREHGTAVASLLIGRTLGALPDAELLAANVFYSTPRGDHLAEAEDLVQAIDWMMVKRVPVVNMSLTGPPNVVVEEAIRRAIARGHVIVAAVGNAGPAAPALFPASYPGVIGVTAVDSERRVYRRANRGDCVDFSAFGVDVEAAAAGGLAKFTGTSFAAPLVAAAVAAKQNTLSAANENAATSAVEQLRSGVVDLGAPGRDNTYGHGLVEGGVAKRVAGR